MLQDIEANEGDRIAVSVDRIDPQGHIVFYFLDSEQHQMSEPWQPGEPPTWMPNNQIVVLTPNQLHGFFAVPHKDTWCVLADTKPGQIAEAQVA